MKIEYTHNVHKHRFAAWAGATAARTSPLCRFRVAEAVDILNKTSIANDVETKNKWNSADAFDKWHKDICNEIILAAENKSIERFTFGVAAKLINVYIKAFLLSELDKYKFIHPPIDDLLLKSLIKTDFGGRKKIWNDLQKIRWSKFSYNDYYETIKNLRESVGPDVALWTVESHWQGFQG